MSEGKVLWRRASRGAYILGLGAFLLLTTQGVLPWSFWSEAVAYWPVLLVGVGIRMIFEKSSAPALILLSPVVVLGTLAYVAFHQPRPGPVGWIAVTAERPAEAESWTLDGDLAMVKLDLKARPLASDHLVEGRVTPEDRSRLRVSRRGPRPRVHMGLRDYRWSAFRITLPSRDNRWELGLAEDLPLDLNLDLVFAEGTIDLDPAPVRSLEIDGVFNGLNLELPAPESDTRLELHGVFNHWEVVVPESTSVRVTTDGLLNLVDGRPRSSARSGPAYRILMEGAFNRLAVRSP